MKTYDEFRKQAQTVWDEDGNGGWVEYQYSDGPGEYGELPTFVDDGTGAEAAGLVGGGEWEGPGYLSEEDRALLQEKLGGYWTDEGLVVSRDGSTVTFSPWELSTWKKDLLGEPDEEMPQPPVERASGTSGSTYIGAATNVPGMNVNQMLSDAKANNANPVTTNGKRYGRNLVGSPYVTKAGYKPGNRERITPPTNAQAATTPSAPPTNPASANPTNPTTDSRGLTPGATTGKVETTNAQTTRPSMTYRDAYSKTKTPTLGTTKTAGLFGGKKDKPKPKEKVISGPGIESWDPDYKEGIPQNYQFDYQPMNDAIYNELNKHYIKLLLDAYRRSTGKELKDPEKQLKVRYGYALGRAPNVNPDIVAQLKPEDQKWLTGWDSDIHNVTPGVVADAVDHLNNGGKYVPLMWENGDEPKRTPKPLKLSV